MKKIETLVEDIYNVFTGDFQPTDADVEVFGRRLARHVSNRISEERQEGSLRLSNLGKPDRQLWYTINRPERAEPLSPEARFKFLYGDILEELLLFLAEQAGHKVEGQQDELELYGVKGHRDAVIDGFTVDAKSASSYSFNRFANGLKPDEDSFGYITQLDSYREAAREDALVKHKNEAAFIVIDKTLGKLCLDIHEKKGTDYESVIAHKKAMLGHPEPPDRCFPDEPEGASGNRRLGVVCSYCPFKKHCWPGLRGFAYSRGPVYLTHVKLEPKVPEIRL